MNQTANKPIADERAELIRERAVLLRDRAELIAALETATNDAEDVYQALARGETPIVSIGRWRRLTEARATLARVRS